MRVRWGRVFLVLAILAVLGCGLVWMAGSRLSGVWEQVQRQADSLGGPSGQPNDATSAPDGGETNGPPATAGSPGGGPSGGNQVPVERPNEAGLPPFKVLTLQYTPYAILALMDAKGYMEDAGYNLQLVDVYAEDVNLDDPAQCKATESGEYEALATTLNAARVCGPGVAAAIPIGQSAGNDGIVVKPGINSWNDVFEHAITYPTGGVSQYLACFASHTANQPIKLPIIAESASKAVDAFINSGAEQNISSVATWQPEIDRALAAVPGSKVILSSQDVRTIWDVLVFSKVKVEADPAPFTAFTRAYYRALLDLSRDPEGAFSSILAWAGDNAGRKALLTTSDAAQFKKELQYEAFATLRDAGVVMDDKKAILSRLDEVAFYWRYCNLPVPDVADTSSMVMPQFVLDATKDGSLLGNPDERPSEEVFQVTDFTNRAAVSDADIQQAQVIFQSGVNIEFLPNRTDFKAPAEARKTLENAVRFLRTCQDCVLEVQGGAAYPGERVCPGCKKEESDALAVDRGRRVVDELKRQFDVPEGQLRFLEAPHPPQHAGSNDEAELRQDRRTFLTGYQLGGR